MENAEYEAMKQRVQRFEPSNGKVSQNNIKKEIAEFITTNFTEEGEYRLDVIQTPDAGRDYSNCKYCEFNKNEELCPKEQRNTLPF
jgi:ribonucleotide reductase beta subunit family protein with ferritin-like domain